MLKRVVITGGRSDLAQAIVDRYRETGWQILCPGRIELDVCDFSRVNEYFGDLSCDLLVCCAGHADDQILYRMEERTWDQVMDVNFTGAGFCAECAIKGMNSGGHVIFISSYAALHPDIGQAAYAAAKASVLGLTKDLARKYGANGIRVNAILPGFMETKMTENISKKRKERVRYEHVLGRFNDVNKVASFVKFLNEEMIFTSGQVFQLDSRLGRAAFHPWI